LSNQNPVSQVRGQSQAGSVIVAIGGGKGGVGKSFISTNLAIFLANMGFNTTLYDLDFGAPNLHTCLGMPLPTKTFHDYINGKIDTLSEAIVPTKVPKLKLISGSNDHTDLANITLDQQSRLMSAIYRQRTDFTILDLSAGTHTSTLDFFLMAERHIITLTPDPTSIENAYRFMKAAFFRKVKRYERQLSLDSLVMDLMSEAEKNDIKYPSDLLKAISLKDPARGQQLKEKMS
jgi:flagellar biosynthesis protein FlhG